MQTSQQTLSSSLITFLNGRTAQVIHIPQKAEIPAALKQIGLSCPRPTLVMIGGAGRMSQVDCGRIHNLFVKVLAPLAEELGAIVIDGGTDAGVIQLMGLARAEIAATFPLVGVAAVEKVYLPNTLPDRPKQYLLEPHHTHFILTPGSKSGDESPWIAKIASNLSSRTSSITILVNGGVVSEIDVRESIAEDRPVVVMAETGRLADEIAKAILHPEQITREEIASIVKFRHFSVCKLSEAETQLTTLLKQNLLSNHVQ